MKRPLVIGAVLLVVVGIAAAGGAWWFFKDDAPAEVSLSSAVESVTATTVRASATTGAVPAATGIAGTWTVDDSTGAFDYDSATGTFAGFRIKENLSSIGSTTAVGRTGDVTGTVTIDETTLSAGTFSVDLTTIKTNESRRDDKVQSALATSQYPTATFTLTQPIDLGASAATGASVSVTAVGDLTIHGTTKHVEIPLQAQLVNGTAVIVGSIDLTFADYGVAVPTSPAVVSVDDHGTLEFQLVLKPS